MHQKNFSLIDIKALNKYNKIIENWVRYIYTHSRNFKINGGIDMKKSIFSIGRKTLAVALTLLMVFTVLPMATTQADAATVRDKAVAYMRNMATIKWTPSKTIPYWSGGTRSFKAGTTYKGMPYTQNNRQNLATFKKYLKNGKYVGSAKSTTYVGNDCSSAVRFAWLNGISAKISFSYTGNMLPGSKTGTLVVGSYSANSTKSTKAITTSNGTSKMYASYAKLQPGDAIFARVAGVVNHARLVTKVTGSGASGKVYCIEQCGMSTARGNTTWNVEKAYTFKQLYSTYYIPITCKKLKDNSVVDNGKSELKIAGANKPSTLKEGTAFSIYGTITSNYKITKVVVGVYDSKGTAISSKTVKPNATSYSLTNISSAIKFEKAKKGSNTYKVVATDEKKTKTLVNVTFSVTKADAASTISISNYNYPAANFVKGTPFAAAGKVTSNYKIKSVTAAIYNSSGKATYTRSMPASGKTFDVSELAPAIKANLLNVGSYTYKVTATDEKVTKVLLSKPFTVKATADKESTLKIAGYNYPTKMKEGENFSIKGDITSNYIINSVTVALLDSKGNTVSSKTVSPKAKTYSIDAIKSYVKFKSLKAGTNTYKVTATDQKKTAVLVNKSINVQAAPAASTLSISSFNYPTGLYYGEIFYVRGNVKSNYKISSVVYGIYNEDGVAVSTKSFYPNTTIANLTTYNYFIKTYNLKEGTYYYKVTAKDEQKTETLVNQKFTVKNSAKSISYKSYTTAYRSTYKDPNSSFTYKWSDEFFNFDATKATESASSSRTGKFATASCAMASAAYVRDNIATALKNMGFTIKVHINYNAKGDESVADINNNDIIGYTIATKDVYVGGVKQYRINAIIVRGTNGYEWVSNFNMGTTGVHRGFQLAVDKLYNSLATYLTGNDKERDRIWITGHSRGAAVTNLLGGKLSQNQVYAKRENIHAFAFACPNTTTSPVSYKNILAYNNEYDFVTNVAPVKWGFTRNGVTINVNESSSDFPQIKTKFKAITTYTTTGLIKRTKSTEYKGLTKSQIDSIVSGMGSYCPSLDDYYKSYTYKDLLKKEHTNSPSKVFNTLGKVLSKMVSMDTVDTVGLIIKGDPATDLIFTIVKCVNGIKHAHCPEFYLAWMQVCYA